MSITITLEITAKAGKEDALRMLFDETLPDTRKFEGCISVEAHSENSHPENIFLFEEWTSKSAYEKYLAWRGERGDLEKLTSLIQGEPVIRFFDRI